MKDWSTIESTLDEVSWEHLAPHNAREVVIVLHSDLDILEIGQRIHEDDKDLIQTLLNAGMITKPAVSQVEEWSKTPNKTFKCLIVAPFVLIQEPVLN